MGQQADMTRYQAYMLNYQVNLFLSSCPLYLDNGNMHALFFLRNDGHDKNGIGSAWSGFDHDIICGAKGAARSVSDLPHGSNEGGANGVSRSVFDLPRSSNGGGAFGALHSVLDLSRSRNRGGEDGAVRPVSDLPHNRNFHQA